MKKVVVSGRAENASEVVSEELQMLRQRYPSVRKYDDWLTAQIEIGVRQADGGELEDHDMDSIRGAVRSETRA